MNDLIMKMAALTDDQLAEFEDVFIINAVFDKWDSIEPDASTEKLLAYTADLLDTDVDTVNTALMIWTDFTQEVL